MAKQITGDELFGFAPKAPPVDPDQSSQPPAPPEGSPPPEPPAPPVDPPASPEPPAPPADPTKSDPPAEPPAPPPSPAFDFVAHFGDKYKDAEQVKSVLTNYETIVQERDTLKEAVDTAQNPFANDSVYKINTLIKNGMDPSLAYRLATLTSDTIAQASAFSVIALKEMADVPEMIGMEADLMEEIKDRYSTRILTEEDDDATPGQIEDSKRKAKRNELLLAKDAAKARAELLKISTVEPMSVSDPLASVQEKKLQREQFAKQWGDITPSLVSESLQEIPIFEEVLNEQTKEVEVKEVMKFKVSQERLKGFDQRLQQLAIARNTPLTKEGLQSLYAEARAILLEESQPELVKALRANIAGAAKKTAEQEFYRPDTPGKPAEQRPLVPGDENLTHTERINRQGEKLFPERSGKRR